MVIQLDPDLEAILNDVARQRGMSAQVLANSVLRNQFINRMPIQPQDEWERRLFGAATDCGVSLPDSAVSSEGLYE